MCLCQPHGPKTLLMQARQAEDTQFTPLQGQVYPLKGKPHHTISLEGGSSSLWGICHQTKAAVAKKRSVLPQSLEVSCRNTEGAWAAAGLSREGHATQRLPGVEPPLEDGGTGHPVRAGQWVCSWWGVRAHASGTGSQQEQDAAPVCVATDAELCAVWGWPRHSGAITCSLCTTIRLHGIENSNTDLHATPPPSAACHVPHEIVPNLWDLSCQGRNCKLERLPPCHRTCSSAAVCAPPPVPSAHELGALTHPTS